MSQANRRGHQAAQDEGDEHSHNGTGTGSAEDVRQRKFHPVVPR